MEKFSIETRDADHPEWREYLKNLETLEEAEGYLRSVRKTAERYPDRATVTFRIVSWVGTILPD